MKNVGLIIGFCLLSVFVNAQINNPLATERDRLKKTKVVSTPSEFPEVLPDRSEVFPTAPAKPSPVPKTTPLPGIELPEVKEKKEVAKPKPAKKKKDPVLSWETANYNFGTIDKGKPVTGVFKFKNITEKPIFITQAKGSCGCTGVKYSEAPILPGESGKIIATYDAKDIGPFKKSLTVITSEDEEDEKTTLYILGEVIWKF